MKVHLGCGAITPENWVNIDRSPGVLLNRVPGLLRGLGKFHVIPEAQSVATWSRNIKRHDVERGLPFPDGSAEAIYSSHMLEHLPHDSARRVLRECRRVVHPDGVVRIAVPDLEALIDQYNKDHDADLFIQETFMGVESRSKGLHRVVSLLSGAQHKWLYDETTLSTMFREAGFAKTQRFGFREGRLPDLDVIEVREESLFVEAYPE